MHNLKQTSFRLPGSWGMAWCSPSCFQRACSWPEAVSKGNQMGWPWLIVQRDRCRKGASGENFWKVVPNTVTSFLQQRSVLSIPNLTGVSETTGGTQRLEMETNFFKCKIFKVFTFIFFIYYLCDLIKFGGLPWWLSGKGSFCNAGATGDTGSILGLGRCPSGGHSNPL